MREVASGMGEKRKMCFGPIYGDGSAVQGVRRPASVLKGLPERRFLTSCPGCRGRTCAPGGPRTHRPERTPILAPPFALISMRPLFALFVLAALAAGCRSETPAAPPADTTATAPAAPATGRTFDITAGDDMHYSLTAFAVAPGDSITVTLRNTGGLPKETFGHNLVLLQQNADVAAFLAEAAGAKDTDFIPAARRADMVAHTRLLGADESDTITFVAPAAAGVYPFLCTFPGHASVMKGTMTVQAAP